ncbi:GntR family transcriptional regulator [Bacillus salipaludis]|uniref:GntR family transcriptional regulator n=1 Tax=Bacillus salipaludis TaxID=2547811 RepID=UPI002E2261F1|nr:GntR family transcriptional regulator [Bacillus salipaludis]
MNLEKTSIVSQIREYIKGEILDQNFAPGQRITINQISKELKCSTVPVREALSSLFADGLVEFVPFSGYVVTPFLDQIGYKHLYETREILELKAIELVVPRIIEDDLKKLEAIVKEGEMIDTKEPVYTQFSPFINSDEKFHYTIFEIAGNPFLFNAWKSLNTHIHISRLYGPKGEVIGNNEGTAEHKKIIEALRNKNLEESIQSMKEHIRGSLNRLIS